MLWISGRRQVGTARLLLRSGGIDVAVAVEKGADFTLAKNNEFTPLMLACSPIRDKSTIKHLKQLLELCDKKVNWHARTQAHLRACTAISCFTRMGTCCIIAPWGITDCENWPFSLQSIDINVTARHSTNNCTALHHAVLVHLPLALPGKLCNPGLVMFGQLKSLVFSRSAARTRERVQGCC